MTRINDYNFGFIDINGTRYSQDVLIYPDGTVEEWWRKQGHSVVEDDIRSLLASGPEVLILGTGASGMMQVPARMRELCQEYGVELQVETTADAVNIFNAQTKKQKTAAGLHLTC